MFRISKQLASTYWQCNTSGNHHRSATYGDKGLNCCIEDISITKVNSTNICGGLRSSAAWSPPSIIVSFPLILSLSELFWVCHNCFESVRAVPSLSERVIYHWVYCPLALTDSDRLKISIGLTIVSGGLQSSEDFGWIRPNENGTSEIIMYYCKTGIIYWNTVK